MNCYEKCSFLTLADQQLDLFSEQPFARLCSFSNGIARMIDSSINMFKDHINLEGTDVTQHLNKRIERLIMQIHKTNDKLDNTLGNRRHDSSVS